MNKTVKHTLLVFTLLSTTPTMAAQWEWFPVGSGDFDFDFTLAATMGQVEETTMVLDKPEVYGAQLSFECPWFSSPQGNLRTHFNHNIYEFANASVRTFEINPHWFTSESSDGLTLGIGVGVGYIWNTATAQDMFSANAVADLEYRAGLLFAGVGVRYMATQDNDMGTFVTGGMDNLLLQLKVGINLF